MKPLNYIILDDEDHVHFAIIKLLESYPDLICKGNFFDAVKAQLFTLANDFDFAFVDIQLGGEISGLNFIRNLNKNILVIIISGKIDSAMEGYKLNIVDFIEKPITPDRLNQAIQKIYSIKYKDQRINELENKLKLANIEERDDFVMVEMNKKESTKFYYENILYILRSTNCTKVVNIEGGIGYSHHSIEKHENKLPKNSFIKVSRAAIINKNYITHQKDLHVIMTDGEKIKIEKACIPSLTKAMNKIIE